MIIIKYSIFALLAIIINILTQELVLIFYDRNYSLQLSILAGTITGLVVKYLLDKKYIFDYQATSKTEDLAKLLLYSSLSIITTLIFWATEFLFFYIFETSFMKYIGAVIGLFIGYAVKYRLDKRYVFKPRGYL